MIRTWLIVIATVVLIISALLFYRSTYKTGVQAGKNEERVITLEQKNKELAEQLEAQIKNTEMANQFDIAEEERNKENDAFVLRVHPTAIDGGHSEELDEQFLQELSKLR